LAVKEICCKVFSVQFVAQLISCEDETAAYGTQQHNNDSSWQSKVAVRVMI
jgi:hypothetical protein